MSIKIELKGWETLVEKYKRAPKQFVRGVNDELNFVGRDIVWMAKQLTPVQSGALRRSIRFRKPERNVLRIMAGGPGTNVNYQTFVEFGTHKQSAQPYLVPAFEIVVRETRITKRLMEAGFKALETGG